MTSNRLIKTWQSAPELAGLVALSVTKLMKTHPARGWVRGPISDTTDLLRQINELRTKNEALAQQVQATPAEPKLQLPDLAGSSESFKISGWRTSSYGSERRQWDASVTWDDMLYHVGPELLEWKGDSSVNKELAKAVLHSQGRVAYEAQIDHEIFKTVRLQFMALGFADVQALNTKSGGTALFWRITKRGQRHLMKIRTVKAGDSSSAV